MVFHRDILSSSLFRGDDYDDSDDDDSDDDDSDNVVSNWESHDGIACESQLVHTVLGFESF